MRGYHTGSGQLQWGRGSVAAEITPPKVRTAHKAAALQWGRGSVAAEISSHAARLKWVPWASMGPRLGGRGDTRYFGGDRLHGLTASMGPRLGGRGDLTTVKVLAKRDAPASMGPRLGGRGDSRNCFS